MAKPPRNNTSPTKTLMHNHKLAEKRIEERKKDFYGIKAVEDLILTEKDFSVAKKMNELERRIVFGNNTELTHKGLKRGIIYSLLTPMQKYEGQTKGFNATLELFSKSENINYDTLANALEKSGVLFHKQKATYILKALKELENTKVLEIIKKNIGTSRENEIKLRQLITNQFKGLGLKTTSLLLRMCGAKSLIPVDSWMIEMLHFHGYPIIAPRSTVNRPKWQKEGSGDKQRKQAMSYKLYLEAERFTLDLAKKYNVSAPILQLAFYTKKSTFSSKK